MIKQDIPSLKVCVRKNPWILSTLVLGIIALILIVGIFVKDKPNEEPEENLCLKIEATPAWVFENGTIFAYGTIIPQSPPSEMVDNLIRDKIILVYSETCGYCQLQIKYFNQSWNEYVESGLTLNCANE